MNRDATGVKAEAYIVKQMSSSEVSFIWKIDQDNYTTAIILPVQLPLTSLPTEAF